MDLKSAITRFNTEIFSDTYNVSADFYGKISVFNEVTNSGESSRRRILETLPDVSIPAGRTIDGVSETYILGHPNPDIWRGEALRLKYPVLPVGATSKVCSLYQILTEDLPEKISYGYPSYTKTISMEVQESDLESNFSFFFPYDESVSKGDIIVHNSVNYYRVRNTPYVDNAGFLVANCILLDSPFQALDLVTKTGYNPVTDTITDGTATVINCFVEEAYLFYDKTSLRAESVKPGDKTITVAVQVAAGASIGNYTILSIDEKDSVYHCHCRLG